MSRNTELDISGHCYLFFFFAASPFLYLQPSCPWARPGPESLIAMAMAVCRGRSVCPVKPAPAAPTAHTTGRVQLCEPLSAGRWLSLRSGSVACLLLSSPPPQPVPCSSPCGKMGHSGEPPRAPAWHLCPPGSCPRVWTLLSAPVGAAPIQQRLLIPSGSREASLPFASTSLLSPLEMGVGEAGRLGLPQRMGPEGAAEAGRGPQGRTRGLRGVREPLATQSGKGGVG